MRTLNVSEAKTHFSHVIEQVVQGETVLISKRNLPIAKITAVDPPAGGGEKHHTEIGWAKGTGARICCDLSEPVLAESEWDMLR